MDTSLVSAAIGLSQAKLSGEVQIAVAKKMLDMQKQTGDADVSGLLNAASTGMDKAANAMVAATTGLGGTLDIAA